MLTEETVERSIKLCGRSMVSQRSRLCGKGVLREQRAQCPVLTTDLYIQGFFYIEISGFDTNCAIQSPYVTKCEWLSYSTTCIQYAFALNDNVHLVLIQRCTKRRTMGQE